MRIGDRRDPRHQRHRARQAGEGASAEEKLRIYIRVFLERVAANGRDSWIHQLISREMADPTPAFDLIIKHGIRPRLEYLGGLVSELLGCPPNDPRVIRCVASLQSQLLFLLNPAVARVHPAFNLTPPAIEQLAEHIAAFSLGGIRAVSRRPERQSRSIGLWRSQTCLGGRDRRVRRIAAIVVAVRRERR